MNLDDPGLGQAAVLSKAEPRRDAAPHHGGHSCAGPTVFDNRWIEEASHPGLPCLLLLLGDVLLQLLGLLAQNDLGA